MAQSVSIIGSTTATAAVTPGVLVLDPTKRSTTVQLTNTVAASCTALVQVEYSLDDPTIPGGPASTWSLLSSATAMQSSNTNGLSWTVLSPIAQVRVNSTSGSTAAAGPVTFTLKALQSITA